jgi:hypothetical protein
MNMFQALHKSQRIAQHDLIESAVFLFWLEVKRAFLYDK